ncbi:MAG: electron transport complex subunit RsxC [Oscillospiraceae bacterium]|nr:electron transport complex subunit RsxC [Oscillospiraceae bacterium]
MHHTFRGGVHPKEHKTRSREVPLTRFYPKGDVVIPVAQHIGKPAKPVVWKGDAVQVGQLIAEADGFVSANVFSSCSGTVKAIEPRRVISGALADCIVIENDGKFTLAPGIGQTQEGGATKRRSPEEILEKVQWAGIVGLGGAGFPTHVKLKPKDPAAIKYVIANGAECEPYLTCNDRLMREHPSEIRDGLCFVLSMFPNAVGCICIEENKPEAIEIMKESLVTDGGSIDNVSVLPLHTKYPQGGEHSLIYAVTGVDYPVSMLPADVGCIVLNVGTLYAICRALVKNEPLYSHVLTVTGDAVKEPKNFIVHDGTSFRELAEACGLDEAALKKALSGGPMMGFAAASLDVPVQKTTNGVTLLTADPVEDAQRQQTACLRCGRCTTVCPQGLLPQLMAEAADHRNFERYEKKLYGLECVSCGSCSYVCPAKRPLTQTFKQVKAEILAQKRAAQAGGAK